MPDSEVGPWKLTAKDVVGGRINYGTARRTTTEAFERLLTDKSRPKVGDVLLTKDGSIGRVAVVDRPGVCINQSVALLRPNQNISAEFLKYLLLTPHYQSVMDGDSDGSTIKHIYITRVDKMQVAVPPMEEQQRIVTVAGSLDDRITLLRETNATLEAIAQALFKSWFVDFDPVRAKQQGLTPAGMDEATAALFPDSFEESELGEVPRGWNVCCVEDFAERVGMGPFGSNIKVETFVGSGVPVISGQHLKQFLVEDLAFNFVTQEHADRLAKSSVQAGDVIFTHAGSIGQVSLLHKDAAFDRYILSQRQFFLRCREAQMSPLWITHYFKTPAGRHQLLANTSQVGVPSIARPVSYLRSIKLVTPPPELCTRFADVCSVITDRVMANRKHINTLIALRDTLLPRLISGQLRLPEATAQLENAVA